MMREMTPREEQRNEWAREICAVFEVFNDRCDDYVSTLDRTNAESLVETIENMIEAALARRGFTAIKESKS